MKSQFLTEKGKVAMHLFTYVPFYGEIGKIFKMRAQAVRKAGIKIERLMKENRKIRSRVKKLFSTF